MFTQVGLCKLSKTRDYPHVSTLCYMCYEGVLKSCYVWPSENTHSELNEPRRLITSYSGCRTKLPLLCINKNTLFVSETVWLYLCINWYLSKTRSNILDGVCSLFCIDSSYSGFVHHFVIQLGWQMKIQRQVITP